MSEVGCVHFTAAEQECGRLGRRGGWSRRRVNASPLARGRPRFEPASRPVTLCRRYRLRRRTEAGEGGATVDDSSSEPSPPPPARVSLEPDRSRDIRVLLASDDTSAVVFTYCVTSRLADTREIITEGPRPLRTTSPRVSSAGVVIPCHNDHSPPSLVVRNPQSPHSTLAGYPCSRRFTIFTDPR